MIFNAVLVVSSALPAELRDTFGGATVIDLRYGMTECVLGIHLVHTA